MSTADQKSEKPPADQPLVAPSFLFRFSAPCLKTRARWGKRGVVLPEAHRIPSFAELEGRPVFADFRVGWTSGGLSFWLRVQGKKQFPWCRSTRITDSDGLQLWIDTRDTHSVHRAGRFCHRFVILPFGGGRQAKDPIAALEPIHRAREEPKPVLGGTLRVRSEARIDGYLLQGQIPATALTGYDTDEHRRLGFTYAIIDREMGWQTFSLGPEFPFMEDPSLWGTLELIDDE